VGEKKSIEKKVHKREKEELKEEERPRKFDGAGGGAGVGMKIRSGRLQTKGKRGG